MKDLDVAALELFLPSEQGTPWITVGEDQNVTYGGELQADWTAGGAAEPSDPHLVVWFAGGRVIGARSARRRVADCLRRGGTVLLVWRSRFLEEPDPLGRLRSLPDTDPLSESTYLLDAGRFLPTNDPGARALARTSKRALLRRTVRRLVPLAWLWRRGLPRWHLSIISSASGGAPRLWIEALLDRVSDVYGEDLTLDQVRWIDRTQMELAVVKLRASSGESFALQVALSEDAQHRLDRYGEKLAWLASTDRFHTELRSALPLILDRGRQGGRAYLVTTWLQGIPGGRYMYSFHRRPAAMEAALRWVVSLHRHSLDTPLEPSEVARWGEEVLRSVSSRAGMEDRHFEREMRRYLEAALDRAPLPTVLGHGDYWLGNLVFDPESGEVRGVLDWDHTDPHAPPLEDALHLVLFSKDLLSTFDPIGRLVRLLSGNEQRRSRQWIAGYWTEMELDPAAMGAAVALYWLRFLDRRERQAPRSGDWYRDNLLSVRDLLVGRTSKVLDALGDRVVDGRGL